MVLSEADEYGKELETPLRSILFVPGSRLDRIQKALDSDADAIIIDLEDAVAELQKAAARVGVDRFLAENPKVRVLLRVNSPGSVHFAHDLEMCRRHPGVAGIMLPKAERVEDLKKVTDCGKPVWPLVETAIGVVHIPKLAACPGVARMSLGALDLSAELGLDPKSVGALQLLDHCRCQLVLHSYANGLTPPVESVYPEIYSEAAIELAARHALEMGLTGMLCIHPNQLKSVNRAFEPNAEEVEWARRVVDKVTDGEAAFTLDGQMIDAPVIIRAKKIIALSKNYARSRG